MIHFVTVKEASGRFAQLVKSLAPGDEILLNDGTHAVARILPPPRPIQDQGTTAIVGQDVSAGLVSLLRDLGPGDEVMVTDGPRAVARVAAPPANRPPRQPGLLKGKLTIIDDGDDVILEQFTDYL
jgi:antitoxin (DNA-binding transcriptional repressor) of toxin-antitoxin stability system